SAMPVTYTLGEGASSIGKWVRKMDRQQWLTSAVNTVASRLLWDIQRCRNCRLMAMEVCLAMGSITDCTTLQVMSGLVEEYVSYQSDWLKFTINFPDDYKETSKYILGLLEEVSRLD
ncbi:hypothetical protein Tco_1199157, partial [Tanacetum coccineum]